MPRLVEPSPDAPQDPEAFSLGVQHLINQRRVHTQANALKAAHVLNEATRTGLDDTAVAYLLLHRERMLASEGGLELHRLEFARWLYMEDRISDYWWRD